MANILGRSDRRRRVLNEEALSASTAHLAIRRAEDDQAGSDHAPRYSERAGVRHHPQVTDFLPNRFSTLSLLAGVGIASTAVVEALHWYVDPVTVDSSGWALGPVVVRVIGGVESWISAVLMLVAAATCLMIYSLRRHRIDDFRGRYRIWLAASIACVAVSVDCVAPVHSLVAGAGAHYTGWTALRADSAWWLVLAGVPMGWIALRAWLDARESRLAAVAIAGAYGLFGASIGAYLAAWPAGDAHQERIITSATAMLGSWTLLVGIVSYGRYVLLDAQGLIAGRVAKTKQSKQASKSTKERKVQKDESSMQPVTVRAEQVASTSPNTLRAFRQGMRDDAADKQASKAQASRWVDGRQPVDEDYEDEDSDSDDRKLSKSDRKKLRKLKAQNRAA